MEKDIFFSKQKTALLMHNNAVLKNIKCFLSINELISMR